MKVVVTVEKFIPDGDTCDGCDFYIRGKGGMDSHPPLCRLFPKVEHHTINKLPDCYDVYENQKIKMDYI